MHRLDYASKVSGNTHTIHQEDLDQLRQDGLNEQQITDILWVVYARNFMSRFLDALGVPPDLELQEREPELWAYLKEWQKVH